MRIDLDHAADFDGWREGVRAALTAGCDPARLSYAVKGETSGLFDDALPSPSSRENRPLRVPREFLPLAKLVICHSDVERFSLATRVLARLQHEAMLLRQPADRDVHRINKLAKEVRRDMHKMKAFVRFRKVGATSAGREQFVAWFEPAHNIVEATAPFFQRRFAAMDWSILTPHRCAHWNGERLCFSQGVSKSEAPKDDALEDYWRSYYASIFNPARLKIGAMTSEMPKKYWKNLPEAELIPDLIRGAKARQAQMRAAEPTPANPMTEFHRSAEHVEPTMIGSTPESLDDLARALPACRRCPLWQPATQAVRGEGPREAKIMLVGEQPGDREDIAGRPFVGPAGQLLDEVLAEAGLLRGELYLTNAVKHFKFTPRGKRRIHQNPGVGEIEACNQWLRHEIALVKPLVIVALGASAIRALSGRADKVGAMGGRAHALNFSQSGIQTLMVASRHPSSILRQGDETTRIAARRELLDDLIFARNQVARFAA